MPLSRKRKKKEARAHRDRDGKPAPAPGEPPGGGGFLSGMRGGLKGLAGAGAKKKESLVSKIVTWAIVAVALYFVARRFGIIR